MRAGIGLKLDWIQGFEGFGDLGSAGFRVLKDLGFRMYRVPGF